MCTTTRRNTGNTRNLQAAALASLPSAGASVKPRSVGLSWPQPKLNEDSKSAGNMDISESWKEHLLESNNKKAAVKIQVQSCFRRDVMILVIMETLTTQLAPDNQTF